MCISGQDPLCRLGNKLLRAVYWLPMLLSLLICLWQTVTIVVYANYMLSLSAIPFLVVSSPHSHSRLSAPALAVSIMPLTVCSDICELTPNYGWCEFGPLAGPNVGIAPWAWFRQTRVFKYAAFANIDSAHTLYKLGLFRPVGWI